MGPQDSYRLKGGNPLENISSITPPPKEYQATAPQDKNGISASPQSSYDLEGGVPLEKIQNSPSSQIE